MFRKLLLDDKNLYNKITKDHQYGVKIDFALLFLYRDYYQYEILIADNIIIIKGRDFFYSPITNNKNDYHRAINLIKAYCLNNYFPLSIIAISKNELEIINHLGLKTFSYHHNEFFNHKPLLINALEPKYQAVLEIPMQVRLIYDASFNDSLAYKNYFFSEKAKQLKTFTENNIITSTLFYHEQTINIKSSIYRSVILFALATLPCYRNQGKMKHLLSQSLIELSENYILAYLHPDVDGFYEKFGFVKYGAFALPRPIKTIAGDLKMVSEIYQEYTSAYDVFTLREQSFWENYERELASDGGYIAIFDNKRGYIAHDGSEVIEFIDLDNRASNNDYNMIRIINLPKFIELFNYQPQHNLQIIDNIIPKNNILIKVNDGDITNISIYDFTKTIFNNLSSLSLEKY